MSRPMDPELLSILCCPETRQPLRPAPEQVLASLNERIGNGTVCNRSGGSITERCEAGLLRQDGKALYPVRSGLPILLVAEAIPLG
ncbi:MAG: Trm112 family protein [Dongiaceae bacterium]